MAFMDISMVAWLYDKFASTSLNSVYMARPEGLCAGGWLRCCRSACLREGDGYDVRLDEIC